MKPFSIARLSEWGVLILVAFSILWRGGKGLESTWHLAVCAAIVALSFGAKRFFGIASTDASAPGRRGEAPLTVWIMVIALIVLSIASYLHSSVQNYGLDTLLRTVSLSLLFLWTLRSCLEGTDSRFFKAFVQIVTVTAIIAALIGICVYVFQPVNRFVGTFFDMRFDTDYWPNAWGDFVLLAWPLMLLMISRTAKDSLRYLTTIGLGLVLGSLLLSYSRGSLIAFGLQIAVAAGFFLYLGLSDLRYKRLLRVNRIEALISIVVVLLIATGLFASVNAVRSMHHDVQSVTEKITFTASEGTSSIDERSQFWDQAWSLSWDHPWLGYGPYSFRFVQPQLMQNVLATSDHAHNVILTTALDLGWPAAILLVLIVLGGIGSSTKMLFNRRRDWSADRDMAAVLLLVSVIGVAAHDMIDYNLQFVGVALPLWLCIAFLFVPTGLRTETGTHSFLRWKLSRTLFRFESLIALLLLIITVTEGVGLIQSSFGRHAEAAGETDLALQWYHRARTEWFSRDMHLSEAQIYLQKNDPIAAQNAIDIYMKENAFDARAWKLQAMIHMREQNTTDAQAAAERAYALGKYTDLGMLDVLLQIDRTAADTAALVSRKLEFDALFSAYADAIEQNTHFIALSQNVEDLLSVSRSLSRLFPNDEKRYKQIARRAADHARTERDTYSAREPGMLW